MKSSDLIGNRTVTGKQLAKVTGVNYSTVRHWTVEDLLAYERHGRQLWYPESENVRRISFIKREQRKKEYQPLSSIKQKLIKGEHKASDKISGVV